MLIINFTHRYSTIYIPLYLFLLLNNTSYSLTKNTGTYRIIIDITNYDYHQNIAKANINVDINLPKGNGMVYIPLPFAKDVNYKFIIEPNSDNTLILFGYVGPSARFSVCQIALRNAITKVSLSLRNVTVPLQESARSESGRALNLLFHDAHDELSSILPDYTTPHLSDVVINTQNFQDSDPVAERADISPGRIIRFSDTDTIPNDITVFLSGTRNPYIVYIVLGLLSSLGGYFTAPNVITTKKKAIWSLILSIISLIAIAVVFFGLLTPQQRITDTTTVVTIGTFVGLLIGFIIASAKYLYTLETR